MDTQISTFQPIGDAASELRAVVAGLDHAGALNVLQHSETVGESWVHGHHVTFKAYEGWTVVAPPTVIRIRRSRIVGNHRYLGWTYHYTTPVDITWNHPDGTSHAGPRAGAWAAANIGSIAELRKRLHRDFPDAELIEEWKVQPFQPRDGGPRELSCTEPDCHGMHGNDYHQRSTS